MIIIRTATRREAPIRGLKPGYELPTTRWHGIDRSSFDRITAPTARAAFGFPAFAATALNVIVLPSGIFRTISRTLSENVFFISYRKYSFFR
jgi:hypothetical protein